MDNSDSADLLTLLLDALLVPGPHGGGSGDDGSACELRGMAFRYVMLGSGVESLHLHWAHIETNIQCG